MSIAWRDRKFSRLWLLVSTCLGCSTDRQRVSVASSATSATPTSSVTVSDLGRGDFQPEDGAFGLSAPEPYEVRLHEVLFAEDMYRVCQLVELPSFEPESAVYIRMGRQGPPLVVSRKLNEQLWALMMTQIEIQSGGRAVGKSISTGPAAQTAALATIKASADTDQAEIDQTTVIALSQACEAALQRARYQGASGGVDGTTYHAGSWKPGAFLAGSVNSPQPGSVSSDYVALAEKLRAYAQSTPSERDTIKSEILAKANHLIARTGVKR